MSRLARLRALDRVERRILYRSLALLPLASLALRVAGLRRTYRLLHTLCGAAPPGAQAPGAERIAALVRAARRHGAWKSSCLSTALTLQALLRRHGIDSELRVGVRKRDSRIEAHAWIEVGGRPLGDEAGGDEGFDAFPGIAAHRLGAAE